LSYTNYLSKNGARCEIRFPDASGNPYLTFAAMLMAGLDGIKNKIHPGESFDKDLYELPPEEVSAIPTVCGSLREAMESLDKDREFSNSRVVYLQMIKLMLTLHLSLKKFINLNTHLIQLSLRCITVASN
jgi:glutamine synthetase